MKVAPYKLAWRARALFFRDPIVGTDNNGSKNNIISAMGARLLVSKWRVLSRRASLPGTRADFSGKALVELLSLLRDSFILRVSENTFVFSLRAPRKLQ
jgi:hypothetical protein